MPFCEKCGGSIEPGSKFCDNCGVPIDDPTPPQSAPLPPPPQSPTFQGSSPAPTAPPTSTPIPQIYIAVGIAVVVIIIALVFASGVMSGSSKQVVTPTVPVMPTKQVTTTSTSTSAEGPKQVKIETTMGDITIALDPDMPITAGNFVSLVTSGYYDGVIFHRVINGFMIQGGDPTGTGRGNPGYKIPDEFTSHNKNVRGTIAMANSGPNTGGSQFFINLVDNSARPAFDTNYPVFGSVIGGMDVVDAIGKVQTSGSSNDRPLQNVTIIRAEMI